MYNAQYINCTGNYTYETRTESPCYQQTMNCLNDCTFQCTGDYTCVDATINGGNENVYVNCNGRSACVFIQINGGNGNVYVNCNGDDACGGIHIYAKTANLLRVNASGDSVLSPGAYIECPQNKSCNITANGESALLYAIITGFNGTKLFITANGYMVMYYAYIYCPPHYLSGTKYTNNAICDISVNGTESLTDAAIYANEGFHNVRIKCENNICLREDRPTWFVCGELLDKLCILKATNNSDELTCDTNICDEMLTTFSPSLSPTLEATTSNPTFSPNEPTPSLPTSYPTTSLPTSYPTPAPTTLFSRLFRLILNSDFNDLLEFLHDNNININDFAIDLITFLISDEPTTTTRNPTREPTVEPTSTTSNPSKSPTKTWYTNGPTREPKYMYEPTHEPTNEPENTATGFRSYLLSSLIIEIMDVYSGSIIIEYALISHDLNLIYLAYERINNRINDIYVLDNTLQFPIILNEIIINETDTTDFQASEVPIEQEDAFQLPSTNGVVALFMFLIVICCMCTICAILICILNLVLKLVKVIKAKLKKNNKIIDDNEFNQETGTNQTETNQTETNQDMDQNEKFHEKKDEEEEGNAVELVTMQNTNKMKQYIITNKSDDSNVNQATNATAEYNNENLNRKEEFEQEFEQEFEEEEEEFLQIEICIYYIFWLITVPIKFIISVFSNIFYCEGCNINVGKHAIHLLINSLSTILLLSHFSFGEDYQKSVSDGVSALIFNGSIKGETIYGLAIICFALINFTIKMIQLYQSNQKWKEKPNESKASIRIKDLQIVIIGSSDTIFKILAAIAVIIGSKYAGSGYDDNNKEILGQVVDFIFVAAVFGPVKEITHLLSEYLTLAVMFNSDDQTIGIESNNNKIFDFDCGKFDINKMKNGIIDNISEKLEDDEFIVKKTAKYSAQKTILWNALWAGFKLLLLAIQQIFALVSAALLLSLGNDVGWFLLIVLLCNFSMILIAFIMCTKYERLSIGLLCKYYLCCFYNLCPIHCENKWIKLDPIAKKLKFNHLGFIQNIDENEGNSIELVTQNKSKENEYYLDWLDWNSEDVALWIMSLNQDYKQYKNKLMIALKEENVTGKTLQHVEKFDIKDWGVKDVQHQREIFFNIQIKIDKATKQKENARPRRQSAPIIQQRDIQHAIELNRRKSVPNISTFAPIYEEQKLEENNENEKNDQSKIDKDKKQKKDSRPRRQSAPIIQQSDIQHAIKLYRRKSVPNISTFAPIYEEQKLEEEENNETDKDEEFNENEKECNENANENELHFNIYIENENENETD